MSGDRKLVMASPAVAGLAKTYSLEIHMRAFSDTMRIPSVA